jgi:hypothetical protein
MSETPRPLTEQIADRLRDDPAFEGISITAWPPPDAEHVCSNCGEPWSGMWVGHNYTFGPCCWDGHSDAPIPLRQARS